MSAYAQVPLGEICKINPRAERTVQSDDLVVSFVPMAAVDEHAGEITVLEERPLAEVSKGYTSFKDGDVLFAKITPCMENGKAALAKNLSNGIGRGSTEFYVLRPGERVLGEFVHHFVRQIGFREEARRNFTGTAGQQRVPKSFIENALLPLPSLDEQRRIVGILNRAARIERLRVQAADRLREFIPALFFRMFGNSIPESRSWPVFSVSEILKRERGSIRTGPFGSQLKHSEFTNQGMPVLGIDNVVSNRFRWAKPRHLPSEKCAEFRRYRVFPGDVIITIMGTTGRVCVAPENLPECMSTKHLCVLTLDRSRVEPLFVWGALLFDENVRAQTRVRAQGQIMEGWNLTIVKGLRLRVPPLDKQRSFSRTVTQALSQEESQSVSSHIASTLSTCLMARLLEESP